MKLNGASQSMQKLLELASRQTNAVIRTWVYGKIVQLFEHNHESANFDSQTCKTVAEIQTHLKDRDTALSPKVQLIISIPQSQLTGETVIDEDGLLIWSQFTRDKVLRNLDQAKIELSAIPVSIDEEVKRFERSEDDFEFFACSRYIQTQALPQIHEYVMKLSESDFIQKYEHLFNFIAVPEMFVEFFRKHTQSPQKSYHSVAAASTFFERALSDIIFTITGNSEEIPTKLSSLLLHPMLEKVLGIDKVFILRTVIGPLNGLNLRNIIWHGFVTYQEYNSMYTSLILLLMLSVSKFVVDSFKDTEHPKIAHPDLYEIANIVETAKFPPKISILHRETLSPSDLESIKKLFLEDSFFVIPGTELMWYDAFQYFVEGDFYFSLVLLFPLIEHAVRRIFVCANDCGERLMTAESDVLYTTLDIILADKLFGKPNRVFEHIPEPAMNALFDIFIWNEGNRVRDLISHGLSHPRRIPEFVAEFMWVVAIHLCAIEVPQTKNHHRRVEDCKTFVECYVSTFHPKAMLFRELNKVHTELQRYHQLVETIQSPEYQATLPVLKDVKLEENMPALVTECKARTLQVISSLEELIGKKYGKPSMSDVANAQEPFLVRCTLPVTIRDTNKLVVLKSITSLCEQFVKAIPLAYDEIHQMIVSRTAWKRHRKNFLQLLACLELFQLIPDLFLDVVLQQLYQLSIEDIEEQKHTFEEGQPTNENSNSLESPSTTNANNNNENKTYNVDDTSFCFHCFNLLGTLLNSAQAKQWQKLLYQFNAFIASKPTQMTQLLSKKENFGFWSNFDDVLQQIERLSIV